jgi:hypothetical protein
MTSLAAVLSRPTITPPRPLPLPRRAEADRYDAAHVRADVAARRLAETLTAALRRGAVVVTGSDLGDALDHYTSAAAEERRAGDALRSPPNTYTRGIDS